MEVLFAMLWGGEVLMIVYVEDNYYTDEYVTVHAVLRQSKIKPNQWSIDDFIRHCYCKLTEQKDARTVKIILLLIARMTSRFYYWRNHIGNSSMIIGFVEPW